MRSTGTAVVAGATAFLLLATACSSQPTVSKKDLASEVSNQLSNTVGHAPESVSCPDDLTGTVGATTRCTLSDSGEHYGVAVKVTGVEGSKVKFDIKVDDHPS